MSTDNRAYWTPPGGMKSYARLFLVRSPITFGHSQLWLEFNDKKAEEHKLFSLVAGDIANVIKVFNKRLNGQVKDKRFTKLAHYTFTRGKYIKTLVLRSSASERPKPKGTKLGEYKVHLVPYFESHQVLCRLNYQENHGRPADGGLLSWLGRREAFVDRWENSDLSTFKGEKFDGDTIDDVARDV